MVEWRLNFQCPLNATLSKLLFGLEHVRVIFEKSLQLAARDFPCACEGINVAGLKESGSRILVEYQPVSAKVLAEDLQLLLGPRTSEHLLLAQCPIVPDETSASSCKLMTLPNPVCPGPYMANKKRIR